MSLIDSILSSSAAPVRAFVPAPPVDATPAERAEAVNAVFGDGSEKQFFATGTELYDIGHEQVARMRAEWEARPLASVALAALVSQVTEEKRVEREAPTGSLRVTDALKLVEVDATGKPIRGFGTLAPFAVRQLADRGGAVRAGSYLESIYQEAPRLVAQNLNHHLATYEGKAISRMRCRDNVNGGTIAAVVSDSYEPLDADFCAGIIKEACEQIEGRGECRAVVSYAGGASNGWTIDVSWSRPIDVGGSNGAAHVGEAHRLGARFRSHDGGLEKVEGSALAERIRCRNASVYTQRAASFGVRHYGNRGRLVTAVREGIEKALEAAEQAMQGWARALETQAQGPALATDRDLAAKAFADFAEDMALARRERGRNAEQRAKAIVAAGGVEREADILNSLTSGADVVRAMLGAFDKEPGRSVASHINGLTRWAQAQAPETQQAAEAYAGNLIWSLA